MPLLYADLPPVPRLPLPLALDAFFDEASLMKSRPQEVLKGQPVSSLKLKRARVRFCAPAPADARPGFRRLCGSEVGLNPLHLCASGRKGANGIESLEFELTRSPVTAKQ